MVGNQNKKQATGLPGPGDKRKARCLLSRKETMGSTQVEGTESPAHSALCSNPQGDQAEVSRVKYVLLREFFVDSPQYRFITSYASYVRPKQSMRSHLQLPVDLRKTARADTSAWERTFTIT